MIPDVILTIQTLFLVLNHKMLPVIQTWILDVILVIHTFIPDVILILQTVIF